MFSQPIRQSLAYLILVTLALTVCFALSTSARVFSTSARSLRKAAQSSKSVSTHSEKLRAVAKDPELVRQRQQILNRLDDLRKTLDVQKLKDSLQMASPAANPPAASNDKQ